MEYHKCCFNVYVIYSMYTKYNQCMFVSNGREPRLGVGDSCMGHEYNNVKNYGAPVFMSFLHRT